MKCPRCQGAALDLRNAGFNPRALERQRTCYVWAEFTYTCNQPPQSERTIPEPRRNVIELWKEVIR